MVDLSAILNTLASSPFNLALFGLSIYCLLALHSHLFPRKDPIPVKICVPELAPLEIRDFTLNQLSVFDGESPASQGRILIAVKRKVYDVTSERRFYGSRGPYAAFAGRDASRGLATSSFNIREGAGDYGKIDELGGLSADEREVLDEWEGRFVFKYRCCGELVEDSR